MIVESGERGDGLTIIQCRDCNYVVVGCRIINYICTGSTKSSFKMVYVAKKPQKMQIDGKLRLLKIGDQIDPSIMKETQLRRLIDLGWIGQEIVFDSKCDTPE